jgi:D-aminoacyl-tRNA deacylase
LALLEGELLKALIQRVAAASVAVEDKIIGEIGIGLVVLLGVAVQDEERDADYLADKITNLRIFSDDQGKFNISCLDIRAEILVISQFTLLADTNKGRQPSFFQAAAPDKADALYNYFMQRVRQTGLKVAAGSFGAHMLVKIFNDGPVTIMFDSRIVH